MQPNTKPDVKTRKSGVRYVEAADILNSESGRREILKAVEHSAAIRQQNRTRSQLPRDAAA